MRVSGPHWLIDQALSVRPHLEEPESRLHRVLGNDLDVAAPVKTYQIVRNSWGMKPSGAICSIAMILISEMYKLEFPHVYEFMMTSFYVDDGCTSVDTLEAAVKLARDTLYVMSKGGFVVKFSRIGGNS